MNQRIRFIEKVRENLHQQVDKAIDSFYLPYHELSKTIISSLKVDLERLQNQIKKDE